MTRLKNPSPSLIVLVFACVAYSTMAMSMSVDWISEASENHVFRYEGAEWSLRRIENTAPVSVGQRTPSEGEEADYFKSIIGTVNYNGDVACISLDGENCWRGWWDNEMVDIVSRTESERVHVLTCETFLDKHTSKYTSDLEKARRVLEFSDKAVWCRALKNVIYLSYFLDRPVPMVNYISQDSMSTLFEDVLTGAHLVWMGKYSGELYALPELDSPLTSTLELRSLALSGGNGNWGDSAPLIPAEYSGGMEEASLLMNQRSFLMEFGKGWVPLAADNLIMVHLNYKEGQHNIACVGDTDGNCLKIADYTSEGIIPRVDVDFNSAIPVVCSQFEFDQDGHWCNTALARKVALSKRVDSYFGLTDVCTPILSMPSRLGYLSDSGNLLYQYDDMTGKSWLERNSQYWLSSMHSKATAHPSYPFADENPAFPFSKKWGWIDGDKVGDSGCSTPTVDADQFWQAMNVRIDNSSWQLPIELQFSDSINGYIFELPFFWPDYDNLSKDIHLHTLHLDTLSIPQIEKKPNFSGMISQFESENAAQLFSLGFERQNGANEEAYLNVKLTLSNKFVKGGDTIVLRIQEKKFADGRMNLEHLPVLSFAIDIVNELFIVGLYEMEWDGLTRTYDPNMVRYYPLSTLDPNVLSGLKERMILSVKQEAVDRVQLPGSSSSIQFFQPTQIPLHFPALVERTSIDRKRRSAESIWDIIISTFITDYWAEGLAFSPGSPNLQIAKDSMPPRLLDGPKIPYEVEPTNKKMWVNVVAKASYSDQSDGTTYKCNLSGGGGLDATRVKSCGEGHGILEINPGILTLSPAEGAGQSVNQLSMACSEYSNPDDDYNFICQASHRRAILSVSYGDKLVTSKASANGVLLLATKPGIDSKQIVVKASIHFHENEIFSTLELRLDRSNSDTYTCRAMSVDESHTDAPPVNKHDELRKKRGIADDFLKSHSICMPFSDLDYYNGLAFLKAAKYTLNTDGSTVISFSEGTGLFLSPNLIVTAAHIALVGDLKPSRTWSANAVGQYLTVDLGSSILLANDSIEAYSSGGGAQSSSVIHEKADTTIFKRTYSLLENDADDISLIVIKKPHKILKESYKAGFEFIKKHISLPITPYQDFSLWLEREHHYDGVPATVYGSSDLRADGKPNVEIVSWTLYSESRCKELLDEDVYDEDQKSLEVVKSWLSNLDGDNLCLMREFEWEIPEGVMQELESMGSDVGVSIGKLLKQFDVGELAGKSGGPVIAKTSRNELVGVFTSSLTLKLKEPRNAPTDKSKLQYGQGTSSLSMLADVAIMQAGGGACGGVALALPTQAYINHLAEPNDCRKRRKKVRFRLFGFFAPIDELRKMLLDPYVAGYLDQVAPHHADLRKALFGTDSTH